MMYLPRKRTRKQQRRRVIRKMKRNGYIGRSTGFLARLRRWLRLP